MGAGFAAGVTEALLIVTPFEVVKIRLQQQQGMDKGKLLYKVRRRPQETACNCPLPPSALWVVAMPICEAERAVWDGSSPAS